MAQTLNAASPTYTSGLLTGPVAVLATEASAFKCSVVKIYISADNTEDSYSYVGTLSAQNFNGVISTTGDFYVRADLKACLDSEVYIDFISN